MFPERKAFSTVTWIVWDELGNFVGIGYPDDAGVADPVRSVSLSYSQGYLTGIPGFMTSQSYHANGMVAQRVLANGVREEYGLNADAMARWGRMRVFSPANQQLWDSGSYEYDGAGNIKAMVRSVADKDSYSYDLVSRLVLANFKAGGNAKQAQLTYDEAGNLKGETTTDYGTRQFAVDASRNRISGCGYDGAGRVTSCGGLSFSWSALGQLVGVQGTGINRSFLYTADGERIAVRNHLGGTVAVFLRDLGGNPLRVYLRTSTGSWSWSRDDVWVGRERVASVYASGVQYVHSDHLGSPRKVTDSLGNVVASNDFYPFGLPAATTGLSGSWFSGYELEHQDTASTYTDDLYFLHARWYFPQVARFLSPDPVRGDHRAPQSFNLVAYVRNNPINGVDRDGRMANFLTPARERAMALAASEADQWVDWAFRALSEVRLVVTWTVPLVAAEPEAGGGTAKLVEDPLWSLFRPLFINFFVNEGLAGIRAGWEAAAWGVVDPVSGEPRLVQWPRSPQDSIARWPEGAAWPAGAVLQVHTHPDRRQGGSRNDPRPSDKDKDASKYFSALFGRPFPVYVLSRSAVWVTVGGEDTRLVVSGKWW